MEKISVTLKAIPEHKKLLGCLSIVIASLLSACVYGFLIGGTYLNPVFLCYAICISFLTSFLVGLIMLGKAFLKRFYSKAYRERQICGIICVLLIVMHFAFYSSANVIFADADNVKAIEVEIVKIENHFVRAATEPSSADLYFIDSTGEMNCIWYEYMYIEDEILPTVGGHILIEETIGAFNYSVCELIEITS